MGVKHVEAFGDSLLVVQQVFKVCQCYNDYLNAYLDKYFDIIPSFDEFVIKHLPREYNGRANALAQQTSGYSVTKITKRYLNIRKPMRTKADCQVLDELVQPVESAGLTAQTGLTGSKTGLTGGSADDANSAMKDDSIIKVEDQDWRVPLISYLRDAGRGAERNIRRLAFKYVLIDDEL